MSNILITGATGFVGKRLAKAIDSNIRVLSREKQLDYETLVCDLQSEVIPDNALDGVSVVFHLAGFAHDLSDTTKIQNIYQKVNVDATIRLANLAVKSNVKRFVFVVVLRRVEALPLGCVQVKKIRAIQRGFMERRNERQN